MKEELDASETANAGIEAASAILQATPHPLDASVGNLGHARGISDEAPIVAQAPQAPQALQAIAERAMELLEIGGPVVAILVALSVAALAIVLAKLIQFRSFRLGDHRRSSEGLALWRAGRSAEALALLRGSHNPVDQALLRAIRGYGRGLPEGKVREEVIRYCGDVLAALRSWFRPLEVIASLAPLLGLFGTVLGMIDAFRQLEAAGNQVNPAVLSGGIWEALLTTAVGLAVAMPVVVLLNWLERKVDRLAHEMDSMVTSMFTVDLSEDMDAAEKDVFHEAALFRVAAAVTK